MSRTATAAGLRTRTRSRATVRCCLTARRRCRAARRWCRHRAISAALGIDVQLKLETANPTRSFKDRMAASAVKAAQEFGIETLLCSSTGNLGAAVAARCASGGPRRSDPDPGRRRRADAPLATGQRKRLQVRGTLEDCRRLERDLEPLFPWGFLDGNLQPFAVEGIKTIAYEIAEQLGWEMPDAIVSPVASGALFAKLAQGFVELAELGLVGRPAAEDVRGPARRLPARRGRLGRRATAVTRDARTPSPAHSRSAIRATASSRSALPACRAVRSPPSPRS